jgi:hypothetical protein
MEVHDEPPVERSAIGDANLLIVSLAVSTPVATMV